MKLLNRPWFLLYALVLLAVLLTACQAAAPRPTPGWQNPLTPGYGEQITLPDGVQVNFSDVTEDTRCLPGDAHYGQAGNAQVLLLVRGSDGKEQSLSLNTNTKLAQTAWTEGHSFWLVALDPELPPATSSEKNQYRIRIEILLL